MSAATVPPKAKAPRRVLLVEDQPDTCETLRLLMEFWGFDVKAAGNGRDGVEKALAWRPDAAVLDIGLPELDGWEVARRVRAGLGGSVLLIALTGYNQPEDRARSAEAGFDFHMTKPAELDALRRLLAG